MISGDDRVHIARGIRSGRLKDTGQIYVSSKMEYLKSSISWLGQSVARDLVVSWEGGWKSDVFQEASPASHIIFSILPLPLFMGAERNKKTILILSDICFGGRPTMLKL